MAAIETASLSFRTRRRLLLVVAAASFSGASCSPDLCAGCDADTEFCQVQAGAAFLQNGNPNPLGEPASARCLPLPDRCTDDVSCACLTCEDVDGEVDPGACQRLGSCSDDGALLQVTVPSE